MGATVSIEELLQKKVARCLTIAMVEGVSLALAGLLLPVLQPWAAMTLGFFIAGVAYEPKGRHVHLATVFTAFGSCLVGGICAGLYQLALCLLLSGLGDLRLSNCTKHNVCATVFAGIAFSSIIVLVTTIVFRIMIHPYSGEHQEPMAARMKLGDPKEALLQSLRMQSSDFPANMQEIETAIASEKYRKAFLLIHGLKERGAWTPSPEDEQSLEDFWWKYAN